MSDQVIRLVIAEDDYLVNEEIKRALSGFNYEIVGEASNGEQALEMACNLKPDVILMDIKMPKMDGLKASRLIQENCPTPIVILSAHESEDLLIQAGKVGAGAYLTKPPRSAEIDRAITIAVARHHDLMEMRRLNRQLKNTLQEIKTLKGMLPICCVCGIVRDDSGVEHGKGVWKKIGEYLAEKTSAKVSHTYCPQCYQKAREQLDEFIERDK